MSEFLGSIAAGETIDFTFPTVDADGAPTTLDSGAASVYKANNTTQSTTGVTLTADYDSVTGLNHVRIVTADSFYADPGFYSVVLTAGTVDGNSVIGATVASFRVAAPVPGRLYVSKSGSDSNTGLSWGQAKLTLAAAKTAASAGTTIEVGPGTYALSASDNLAKAGVNWQGDPQAFITSPDAINAERWIFDDGGSAMTFSVTGFGGITNGGGTGAFEGRSGILKTSNAASVVNLEVHSLTGVANALAGTTGAVANCVAGRQRIQANRIIGNTEVVLCDGGEQFVYVESAINNVSSGLTAFWCTGGTQVIRCDHAAGFGADIFHVSAGGHQIGWAGTIDCDHDPFTCNGATSVQHIHAQRATGGVYHQGGEQRIHIEHQESDEYCVLLTGSNAGTLTLSGGVFNAGADQEVFDVRSTNANRRVVLLSGVYTGDPDLYNGNAGDEEQTFEVSGAVTLDGTVPAEMTVSSDTRLAVDLTSRGTTATRTALGLAAANLDSQLIIIGSAAATAEFEATAANTAASAAQTAAESNTTAIAGLNDLSASDVLTQATAALTTYDPPTRTESTADKAEVLAAVDGIEGGGGGTVTADDIDPDKTWTFPRQGNPILSADEVEIGTITNGTTRVQFNLEGSIEKDAVVDSVTIATMSEGGPTIGTAELHTSKRRIILPLTDIDTPGRYLVTVEFVSTDSQSESRKGYLVVS